MPLLSILGNQSSENSMEDLWLDEEFKEEFTASYDARKVYEPSLDQSEKNKLKPIIKNIKENKSEDAINNLKKELNSEISAAFDFLLANLYFQDGQLLEAAKYYKQAIAKYPSFRRAYKNLGLLYIQNGDFKSAIESLSRSIELGEIDGRAYGLLGYSYLIEGLYFPAEAAYRQAILMQPKILDWKLGLSRCLIEMEQFSDAVGILNTVININPDNSAYWIAQANAFLGMDQTLKAAQNLEVVRRMGAGDLSTLSLLGDIYMNDNMPDLALSAYMEAVDLADGDDIETLIKHAGALNRTGNFKQSDTIISNIRTLFSDKLEDQSELKLLTYEARIARASGDDKRAAILLGQIIERDLLNGDAIIELAKYHVEQGKLPEAITRFEQAQKITKFERKALIAHAQALVSNQQYTKAVNLLDRALRIESDKNLKEYAERVRRAAKG